MRWTGVGWDKVEWGVHTASKPMIHHYYLLLTIDYLLLTTYYSLTTDY